MNTMAEKGTCNELTSNILVVEDEKTDAVFIERAFSKSSFIGKINIVLDGQQALDYIRGLGEYRDRVQYPVPDLILLDLKLPKVSGLEVLKEIKVMKIMKRIPVVVLSASDQPKDIKDAYDYGANSYFVKKVKFSQFITMAEQINQYWFKYNQAAPLTE